MRKIIVFILFSNVLLAQNHQGVVCDSVSKLPIGNVEVFTNYESTMTNEKGEFDLKTNQKYVYLKTVFMGLPKVASIENLKVKDTLFLSENIQLKEVVVTARKSILKEVVANISKNYNTQKKYKTQMFTHSNLIVNDKPELFTEIVSENTMNFEVESEKSKGLFGLSRKTKTTILGLRKITSGSDKMYKYTLRMSNIIDWGIDPLNFLEKGVTKIEEYDEYFVLRYSYTTNLFNYSGWFSVNKEDYAIIENYEKKESQWDEKNLLKYNLPKTETSHIFFDKKEGFPYYTRKLLLVHQEFLMTNKETNTTDKVALNFKMFNSQPTFEDLELPEPINESYYNTVQFVKYPYNETFWKNYNVPKSSFEKSELYQDLKSLE